MKNEKELSELRTEFSNRLDDLHKYFNEKLKQLSESDKTTQFEKGKWYKNTLNSKMWFIESVYIDGVRSFGFDSNGNWCNSQERQPTLSEYILATPLQVQEALTKQATKLGIVEGATVERPDCFTYRNFKQGGNTVKLDSRLVDYSMELDSLMIGAYTVYQKGVFAKVVTPKEEPIMIGGRYEVKIYSGGYSDKCTTIDGHRFSKEFWEAALIVSETSKAGAYVGCDAANGGTNMWPVKTETIKQILSRF